MKILRLIVGGCLATSCAASPDVPAQDVATAALEQSLSSAQNAASSRSVFLVQTRYNPARCDCPPYEIFVYDAWQRVWMTGNQNTLKNLEDFGKQSRAAASTLEIRGRLLQSSKLSRENVRFFIFEAD